MAKNILFEEIYDGVLCEAAESFEAEINITNKEEEEGKTVEKSRFVELSEDDLDVIVDRAEAHKPPRTQQNGEWNYLKVSTKQ